MCLTIFIHMFNGMGKNIWFILLECGIIFQTTSGYFLREVRERLPIYKLG